MPAATSCSRGSAPSWRRRKLSTSRRATCASSCPARGSISRWRKCKRSRGSENVARSGVATQISTAFDGPPQLAIDGNTNGDYHAAHSTTHTAASDDPWWEVDLRSEQPLDGSLFGIGPTAAWATAWQAFG